VSGEGPLVSNQGAGQQAKTVVKQNFTAWYVAGVLFIIALVVIGVLVLTVVHPGDNTAVVTVIITLALPAITSLLGYIKSQENGEDIRIVHGLVNSQTSNLVAAAEKIALAEGRLQGIAEQVETVRKQAVVALAVKAAGGSSAGVPVVVVPLDLPLIAQAAESAKHSSSQKLDERGVTDLGGDPAGASGL
jgi:hypothetical protein